MMWILEKKKKKKSRVKRVKKGSGQFLSYFKMFPLAIEDNENNIIWMIYKLIFFSYPTSLNILYKIKYYKIKQ